jgi:hypothetical protein
MDRRTFINGVVAGIGVGGFGGIGNSADVLVRLANPAEITMIKHGEISLVDTPPPTVRDMSILGQPVYVQNPDPVTRQLTPFRQVGTIISLSHESVGHDGDVFVKGTRVRFGGQINTVLDFEGFNYIRM